MRPFSKNGSFRNGVLSTNLWAAHLSFWSACAILALEVALLRVFSVVLWYHFGFLILSLAMLGFALAGAALHGRALRLCSGSGQPGSAEGNPSRGTDPFLARGLIAALAGAGLILPAVMALTRIPLDPLAAADTLTHALLLALVVLLTAVPFFLLGYAHCAALKAGQERINRVYGCAFLGGAAGTALALLGMEYLGGGGGVLLATGAAWYAGGAAAPVLKRARIPAILSLLILAAFFASCPEVVPRGSRKHFPKITEEQFLHKEWNASSSVVFYRNPERHGLWAMPDHYKGALPEMLGVAIDDWAIASMVKWDGDTRRGLEFFDAYPPTLGLASAPEGFDALVIGAGGGIDVLAALYYGAGSITAVEINPIIVDGVMNRYREFTSDLYRHEKVKAVVAEGRHFIERDEKRYHRIVLTGVDTFAATAAGAFALCENYIYTVESFQAYFRHLKPGGMICITRWFYDPPRQTLRLVAAAREALLREGVENASSCFFIARAKVRSLILIKKEPFRSEEVQDLLRESPGRGLSLAHAEGFLGHPIVEAFFVDSDRSSMESHYPYRVDAPTDDCPYLFEHRGWETLFLGESEWFFGQLGGQEILLITFLALAVCFGIGLLIITLLRSRRVESASMPGRSTRALTALLFVLIGAGYLTCETALLPKLVLPLGHPVYAMSIVLVGLLVFSGLGSLLSRTIPANNLCLGAVLLGVTLFLPLFFIFLYSALGDAILHAAFPTRVILCLLFLAVPGFVMGLPFPLAVRCFAKEDGALIPRAFLWSGAGSALACPAATALVISWGFQVTFLVASCSYLVAGMMIMALIYCRNPGSRRKGGMGRGMRLFRGKLKAPPPIQ